MAVHGLPYSSLLRSVFGIMKITPVGNSKITPAKGSPAAGPRGPGKLVERLTAQVGSEDAARAILMRRGHMADDGTLTDAGRARDAMSAEERAIDRAKKRSKTPFGQMGKNYTYDPSTNRAKQKRSGK